MGGALSTSVGFQGKKEISGSVFTKGNIHKLIKSDICI